MNCPKCNSKTVCVDSRPREGGLATYRRYKCKGCSNRFRTYEIQGKPPAEQARRMRKDLAVVMAKIESIKGALENFKQGDEQ